MAHNVYSQKVGDGSQGKTALLIIDIQNDYFADGACELVGSEQASEKAKLILEYFREQKNPIIHIQHISANAGAIFFLPNTFGVEIHSSVSPLDGETLINKNYPNSFRETDLSKVLKEIGVSELVIVGMMTHMCIDATTRAAKDFGFNCTVIGDACATKDLMINDMKVTAKDVQNAFLSALSYYYADVIDYQTYLERK